MEQQAEYLYLGKAYDDTKALVLYQNGTLALGRLNPFLDENRHLLDNGQRVYNKNYSPVSNMLSDRGEKYLTEPGVYLIWAGESAYVGFLMLKCDGKTIVTNIGSIIVVMTSAASGVYLPLGNTLSISYLSGTVSVVSVNNSRISIVKI